MNKKIIIYSIIILLSIIIVVSGTYAFFQTLVEGTTISTDSSNFEVIYLGGEKIGGQLELTNSKTENMKTTVNIRVAPNSVLATANLYIQIENISENIAINALKWEVYKTYKGETKFVDTGSFDECEENSIKRKCKADDKIYIVNDYRLSEENTAFTIYIWLDGNLADNKVIGGTFKGHIGAETENFSGNMG